MPPERNALVERSEWSRGWEKQPNFRRASRGNANRVMEQNETFSSKHFMSGKTVNRLAAYWFAYMPLLYYYILLGDVVGILLKFATRNNSYNKIEEKVRWDKCNKVYSTLTSHHFSLKEITFFMYRRFIWLDSAVRSGLLGVSSFTTQWRYTFSKHCWWPEIKASVLCITKSLWRQTNWNWFAVFIVGIHCPIAYHTSTYDDKENYTQR